MMKNSVSINFKVAALDQSFFYYNLNTKVMMRWLLPKLITFERFVREGSLAHRIRISWDLETLLIERGGWHLSYFGDVSFVQTKIKSFSEAQFNNEENTNEDNILTRIEKFEDIFGRQGVQLKRVPLEENDYLPPRYAEFLERFVLL